MSIRTWQKAVIFTAVASSSISTALASEPINPKIDPCDSGHAVTLVGVLAAHHEYGPPGWGEDPALVGELRTWLGEVVGRDEPLKPFRVSS